MRAAHHVAVELVTQDLGVPALGPVAHGEAGVGEVLVAVGAEELDPPAVQEETVELEAGVAEAGAGPVLVQGLAVPDQGGHHVVELGALDVPQRDLGEPVHTEAYHRAPGPVELGRHHRRAGPGPGLGVDDLDAQQARALGHHGSVDGALHLEARRCREHVERLGEHVVYEDLGHGPQADLW